MTPTGVPEGVDTTTPTDTTELTKADTNDVHENLSFPTATPEIIKAISTDYEGPSTMDATIISSAPNNTNTNYHTNNAMQDFMNPHAVPAAANAAIAQRGTCSMTHSFS